MLGFLISHYMDRKASRSRGFIYHIKTYNHVCLFVSFYNKSGDYWLKPCIVCEPYTSNTHSLYILLLCACLLHAIRVWHRSIRHCVTAYCLHCDTDITLQWVGIEQASFHASPAYCGECNLSLVWVMMAVKPSSQPLLAIYFVFVFFSSGRLLLKH